MLRFASYNALLRSVQIYYRPLSMHEEFAILDVWFKSRGIVHTTCSANDNKETFWNYFSKSILSAEAGRCTSGLALAPI